MLGESKIGRHAVLYVEGPELVLSLGRWMRERMQSVAAAEPESCTHKGFSLSPPPLRPLSLAVHLKEQVHLRFQLPLSPGRKGDHKDPLILSIKKSLDRVMFWKVEDKFRKQWSQDPHCVISQLDDDIKAARKCVSVDKSSNPVGNMEPRNVVNKRPKMEGSLKRLVMACLGGAFLIGPMLLVVLNGGGQLTLLFTPSVCVFAFGVAMAIFLDNSFNPPPATAACYAVLVVFVGTTIGSKVDG